MTTSEFDKDMELSFLISYTEYNLFTGYDIDKSFKVTRSDLYKQLQIVFYAKNTKNIKVSEITKIEYESDLETFIQNLND